MVEVRKGGSIVFLTLVSSSFHPDWTHEGITNLFSEVKENGYDFLFLSSRSIAQVTVTVPVDGFGMGKMLTDHNI